jgi:hypothetical protein
MENNNIVTPHLCQRNAAVHIEHFQPSWQWTSSTIKIDVFIEPEKVET